MNEDFVSFELAVKLKEKGFNELCLAYYTNDDILYYNYSHKAGASYIDCYLSHNLMPKDSVSGKFVDAPTIAQVLEWLRKEKNIDVEIHAEVGMLGIKVYSPYICTYTEFTFETSPDDVRYRQKKFNPTTRLPHEIIPAHIYFEEWEQAALAVIKYVLDNLI